MSEPEEAAEAPRPRIKVKALIDTEQMDKDVRTDPSDLSTCMMNQASLFAHYGVLHAKAAKQVDDLKLRLGTVEAKVDKIIRDKAMDGGFKTTEPSVAKEIARHPLMIEAHKLLNEAKYVEKLAKTAVESFEHRRDMLIQMGAQHRKEMDGELRMMGAESREAAAAAQRARVMSIVGSGSRSAAPPVAETDD